MINLVPNPSFEDVNICSEYNEPCCPESWRSTTLKAFYYIDDSKNERSRNATFDGHRQISLCMYNAKRAFDRSFTQTPLLCTLEKGKRYAFSVYYKVPEKMIGSFGVHFSDTLNVQKNNKHLEGIKASLIFTNKFETTPLDWILVQDTFLAKGNEKVLILGNFETDEQTKVVNPFKRKKNKRYDYRENRVYYRFDKISLIPLDDQPVCDIQQRKKEFYEDNVRHAFPVKKKKEIKPETLEQTKEPIVKKEAPKEYLIIEEDSIVISETFELPNILFNTNSDQLLPIAYPSLKKLANYLLFNRKYQVSITGHTDNVGSDYANQSLSERRAKAVHNYLIQQGVTKQRITFFGKGESEPIDNNSNEQGRANNRRVEFELGIRN